MLPLLSACIELPEANVPDLPPEDTAPEVTGVELIADPTVTFGTAASGPHSDPRLRYSEGNLLLTWIANGDVDLALVPILDPELLIPIVAAEGVAAGGRPDTGSAEQRQVGVWTEASGEVVARGVLQGGGLMDALAVGDGAVPGSVRMDVLVDGAADLVWTTGTQIVSSGFDRLLADPEPAVVEAEAGGAWFDAAPAPTTGFFAAWVGIDGSLLAGPIPPATSAVVVSSAGATDPTVAVRDDGGTAVAFVDGAGGLFVSTAGAPGSVEGPIALGSGASQPVVAWVADRVAIIWRDGTTLRLGLYDTSGASAATLDLGEASGRATIASREVNGGWELALAWPGIAGELSGTFVVVVDRI